MNKEFEAKQAINFTTKLSEFKVLNPDFTRCRCNIFYTGKNRNYSNITDLALQKLISRKGYANVPVVGHIKTENGNTLMGGHDRKIEIDDEIKIINECVAYGVIPEDCNPAMEKITDIHGIEKEYFSVDIILWTHYFPEVLDAAGDSEVFFNQSMEIEVTDGNYDENYEYFNINDFNLQALCLLGRYSGELKDKSVEPCFEDSVVKRFSVDETFKQNFEKLLEKLKKYESDKKEVSVSTINNDTKKKGDMMGMDFSKILDKMSEIKAENSDVSKYAVLDITDASIGVLDREDYKAYSFNYAIVEDEVVIDFESKTECRFSVADIDETKDCFDLMAEINSIKDDTSKSVKSEVETMISNTYAESYNKKIQAITEQFDALSKEHNAAMEELERYRAEDAHMREVAKKNEIDEIVNKFELQMNRYAAFMIWKANLDYSKTTPEQVNKELTLMLGKMTVENGKKSESFSYKPTVAGVTNASNKSMFVDTERYGDYFNRLIHNDD